MIGYSIRLQQINKEANGKLLGVKLGRYCIRKEISVIEVMEYFEVSKQTVYNWFTGVGDPKGKNYDAIKDYLAAIS